MLDREGRACDRLWPAIANGCKLSSMVLLLGACRAEDADMVLNGASFRADMLG